MSVFDRLKTTKTTNPPVSLLYGVDGVGKTSLASEWPGPILYLPTEGERPPSDVEMTTPGTIETFHGLLDIFGELLESEHEFKTVIVDSLDGLEALVWAATSMRLGLASIEDAGYGKGYIEADTEWKEYLAAVSALARAGIYVVQLAHPEIVRFDSPTTDPYSRYTIKLHKRANALVREQADLVLFMNYRVSLKEKDVGFNKKVSHAEGDNERLMHFAEKAGFTAKNRYSMPDNLPFKKGQGFSVIAPYLPSEQANDDGKPTKR